MKKICTEISHQTLVAIPPVVAEAKLKAHSALENSPLRLIRDLIPDIAKYLNSRSLGNFALSNKSLFLETLGLRRKAKIPSVELMQSEMHVIFPRLDQVKLEGQLFDVVIEALAKKAAGLTILDLSETEDFDENLLSLIAQRFPELTQLNLSGCDEMTDAGLAHLASLHKLTSLDLSDCSQITDDGLQHLTGLKSLQALNLSGCDRVTDGGLLHLAALEALVEMNLGGCFDITDAGLPALNKLENLKALNLTDCENITSAGIADVREGVSVTTGR